MIGKNMTLDNFIGSAGAITVVPAYDGLSIIKQKVVFTTVTDTEFNVPRKSNFKDVTSLGRVLLPFLRQNFTKRANKESNFNAFVGEAMNETTEIGGVPQPLDFSKIKYTRGGLFQPIFTLDSGDWTVSPTGVVEGVVPWSYNASSSVQDPTDEFSYFIVSKDRTDYDFGVTGATRLGGTTDPAFVIDPNKEYYFCAYFKSADGTDQSTSVPIAEISVAGGVVAL